MTQPHPIFIRLRLCSCILLICALSPWAVAKGTIYRAGGALGFGGSGLTKVAAVDGQATVVERSDGPLVFSLFIDRLLSDQFGLGLEHNRGLNFAPFSMGSTFTGVTAKWYFFGSAASVPRPPEGQNYLLVQRFVPYAGIAGGAAMVDIKRENDLVPEVGGSGVYFGLRLGADYQMGPGVGIRPEFVYSTTIMQPATVSVSLSEYYLGCGLFFIF